VDAEGVIAFSGNRFYCFSHEMRGKRRGESLLSRKGLVSTGHTVLPDTFPLGHPEKEAWKLADMPEVRHHGATHQVFESLERFFEV
jgi:hypothetical protein